MSEINPSALKVVELRAELSKRGLPQKGKKDELIARLTEAIEADKKNKEQIEQEKEQDNKKTEEETETASKAQDSNKDNTNLENKDEATILTEKSFNEQEKKVESVEEEDKNPISASSTTEIDNHKNEQQKESEPEPVSGVEDEVPKQQGEESKMVMEDNKASAVAAATEKEAQTAGDKISINPVTDREIDEEKDVKMKDLKATKETATSTTKSNTESNSVIGTKRRLSTDPGDTAEDGKRTKIDDQGMICSPAFYVKGFVRPLITSHVKNLLEKYGKLTRFWMDQIKTHCYVIYENESDAKNAARNIDGIVFPEETGKKLTVGELTPEQTEELIEFEKRADDERRKVDWEACIKKVKAGEGLASTGGSPADGPRRRIRQIGIGQIARELSKAAAGDQQSLAQNATTPSPISPASNNGNRIVRVADKREHEPVLKKERSLDDLFRKTEALPRLYYLPNTDEEAEARLEKLRQRA
ncbi:hypothetical protein BDF20DRAFT_831417 [Mycotypha africana]|uniref:uncharacterized protein n=1 Tax=Mycotypha africana TaxID=64632 RepID=UPI0022FFD508|nr:uncharacterized protein BDF20DRAFT_831417 [Mycotypha africana]KAI8991371.1 hypothetical protein BDF20DRAFT_831417 [Mycotypha africana]